MRSTIAVSFHSACQLARAGVPNEIRDDPQTSVTCVLERGYDVASGFSALSVHVLAAELRRGFRTPWPHRNYQPCATTPCLGDFMNEICFWQSRQESWQGGGVAGRS